MRAAGTGALALLGCALLAPLTAVAQSDEIQVYDGVLAGRGKFNLTLHNNFTPNGITTPAFAGGVVPDKSFNGVPEWAYGVMPWFEAGLYLPLYTVGRIGGRTIATLNGFKLRTLFAVPHADERQFFYGVNFEFSYNARHWEERRFTSEIRPIVGWHLSRVDVIVNPIFDTSYDGLGNLDFAPASRIAFHPSKGSALALEEYDDFGPVHQIYSRSNQAHQLYAVVDRNTRFAEVEAGIGLGLTNASDRLTLKLILSRDLN